MGIEEDIDYLAVELNDVGAATLSEQPSVIRSRSDPETWEIAKERALRSTHETDHGSSDQSELQEASIAPPRRPNTLSWTLLPVTFLARNISQLLHLHKPYPQL